MTKQTLLFLHFSLSLAYGQLFDFLVTRPTQNNFLVFRCENSQGPVQNPTFYRNSEPVSVTPAPDNEYLYQISRQLEGLYACGNSDAVSNSQRLVAWPDRNCPEYTPHFTGKAGSTVRLDCPIPPGVLVEQYYVTWRSASDQNRVFYESFPPVFNRNPVNSDPQGYSVDSRNFSLYIHNATPAHQVHNYVCILGVEDPHPDLRQRPLVYSQTEGKNLSLSISQDPSFAAEPEGKVTIKGETVNFTCSTTSSPRPAPINWLHHDQFVRLSNRYDITEENSKVLGSSIFTSTLTLRDVSGEDSGFVECRSVGDGENIFSQANLDVLDEVEEFNPIALQSGGFVYDIRLKSSLQVPVKLLLSYTDASGEESSNFTSPESYFNSQFIKHIADSDRVPFSRFRVKLALMYKSKMMGPFFYQDKVFSRAGLTDTDISLTTIVIILVSVIVSFVILELLAHCLFAEIRKMLRSRLEAKCLGCFSCKAQNGSKEEQRRAPNSSLGPASSVGPDSAVASDSVLTMKSKCGFNEKNGRKYVQCFISFCDRDEVLKKILDEIFESWKSRTGNDEPDGQMPSAIELPQARSITAETKFSYEVIESGRDTGRVE